MHGSLYIFANGFSAIIYIVTFSTVVGLLLGLRELGELLCVTLIML